LPPLLLTAGTAQEQQMNTLRNMFPLLGEGALRRALLRGGSIEATVEALLDF